MFTKSVLSFPTCTCHVQFRAQRVRDFAFASSSLFLWEAETVEVQGRQVKTMALYPAAAEALWSRYALPAVQNALHTFSEFTIPYPYPHATVVNGPVGGMEYPMLGFCAPRSLSDDTYSKNTNIEFHAEAINSKS